MTLHTTPEAMMQEALAEMMVAAEWCIGTNKAGAAEGSVFGYPGAVLLCAAIAALGSWVTPERSSKGQFREALLDDRFFELGIDKDTANLFYERVRNLATHNSLIARATTIEVGTSEDPAILRSGDQLTIRLMPLLQRTRHAVQLLIDAPSSFIDDRAQAKRIFDLKDAALGAAAPDQLPPPSTAASGMVSTDVSPSSGIAELPRNYTRH